MEFTSKSKVKPPLTRTVHNRNLNLENKKQAPPPEQKKLHPPQPKTGYLTRKELKNIFAKEDIGPEPKVFLDLLEKLKLSTSTFEIFHKNDTIKKILDALRTGSLTSTKKGVSGDMIFLMKLFQDFAAADPKAAMRLVKVHDKPAAFAEILVEISAYHHAQFQLQENNPSSKEADKTRKQYLLFVQQMILNCDSPAQLDALIADCPPSAEEKICNLLENYPAEVKKACAGYPKLEVTIGRLKQSSGVGQPPVEVDHVVQFTAETTQASQKLLSKEITFSNLVLPEEDTFQYLGTIAAQMLLMEPGTSIREVVFAMLQHAEGNASIAQNLINAYHDGQKSNGKTTADVILNIVDPLHLLIKDIKNSEEIKELDEKKVWSNFFDATRHALIDLVKAEQRTAPRPIHALLLQAIVELR